MSEKVLVLVDCISTYRVRYCVEVDAAHPEYALDTVTMEKAKEFSQKWLGETIFSHRVVTKEEALCQLDEDEPCYAGWSDDHKLNVFVTQCVSDDIQHSEHYYDTDRNK